MKKIKLIVAGLAAMAFFAEKAPAQTADTAKTAPVTTASTTSANLVGKWDILFKGLPNGDTHIIFNVTEQDGKLSGTYQDLETKKDIPLTKVEKDDKGLVLYFIAQGYDVNVNIERKDDDDHVKASMMGGMFEGAGERVKQ
ncbi:MAG TPA: hypothetical protein VHB54_17820 [Mucilaginibacter sp.]|nr:hypothetical protein [Mucilaginibacter sp.]